MSNLSKLEFVTLDISGNNYLPWVLDAEIHLDAKGLGDTIKKRNEASSQDKAKAMIFLRHHLDEGEPMNNEDMLEKTISTFHASNMVLQEQYREKGFKKYSELISCFLVAEQHNAFLMKNHEVCSTGSAPFPEADLGAIDPKSERRRNNYRGRINICGCDKRRNNNRYGGGHYK
ncbi:uncharacterized protein [Nicotiana tomentosiformis]|uniref:uncharacterized protein n=1 Tax=Nicotiana tomentosiformis TaxID=4098 RepID=UPI00388CBAE9